MNPCGHLFAKGCLLGSPVCDVFLCFVTFSYCNLGQALYLIVSIPDLCLLSVFFVWFGPGFFSANQNHAYINKKMFIE